MNWKAGSSVVDPVLGSGIKWIFLAPGSGIKISEHTSGSLVTFFWVKTTCMQRTDLGWKFQSRDKHPGSAKMVGSGLNLKVGPVGWLTCEASEVWEGESVNRCLQLCGWGWGEVAGPLHHLAEVLLHHVPAHTSFDNLFISLVWGYESWLSSDKKKP